MAAAAGGRGLHIRYRLYDVLYDRYVLVAAAAREDAAAPCWAIQTRCVDVEVAAADHDGRGTLAHGGPLCYRGCKVCGL